MGVHSVCRSSCAALAALYSRISLRLAQIFLLCLFIGFLFEPRHPANWASSPKMWCKHFHTSQFDCHEQERQIRKRKSNFMSYNVKNWNLNKPKVLSVFFLVHILSDDIMHLYVVSRRLEAFLLSNYHAVKYHHLLSIIPKKNWMPLTIHLVPKCSYTNSI